MRILNFKLFELLSYDDVIITQQQVKGDCMDILQELQDEGFDIRFSPFTGGYGYIDISNYNKDFTWKDVSDFVERIIEYCKLNNLYLDINGQMGISTSSYKYFEFKNNTAEKILDYNDIHRWPNELYIRVLTFEIRPNQDN